MRIGHEELTALGREIFRGAGCEPPEDGIVARRLVEANLVGHDSHGVIRIPPYVGWLRRGMVRPNRAVRIVFETDSISVLDGDLGLGQSIGEQAMRHGIEKTRASGVAVLALRNTGHLGRIGDWAELAARAGVISLHWVNTNGFGILVAPFGGIDRRLSANPIAAGVPVEGGEPIIFDISTSAIAEGKLKVARNQGTRVPPGCIIDSDGRPTDDPRHFYADPPGALLPFGGHKGYGLAVIAEVLAGALAGSGCSDPANTQHLVNGMLAILLDPARFPPDTDFAGEVRRFIDHVKSSRRATPDGEILMPGELEARTRARRLAGGIELDETTWRGIVETAEALGVEWKRFAPDVG